MLSESLGSDHEKPPPSLPGAARWMIVERAWKASGRETSSSARGDRVRLVSSASHLHRRPGGGLYSARPKDLPNPAWPCYAGAGEPEGRCRTPSRGRIEHKRS